MLRNFDKIKLADATLYEYALANLGMDLDLHKDIQLRDFYKSEKYHTSVSKEFSPYTHKKQQAVFRKFLQEYNLQITSESSSFSKHNPPVMCDCEIDVDVFVKIYQSAVIFAINDNYKICLEINRYANGNFAYVLHSSKSNDNFLNELDMYASANNVYKCKKISCTGKFLQLDDLSWDDVILKDGVKDTIVSNIDEMFRLRDKFKTHGITVKRGIILHGEPGTGKTKICKCLAKDANYSVLYALPSDFNNTSSIRNVCDMAKDLSPCLLVLEDIDWIAQDRSKSGPFVMELMNKIDGIESFGDVITLATTNCLEDLENAVKNRPGRFDRLIKIDLPNNKAIKKMIERFTHRHIIDADVDIEFLTKCCENLSGAHINDLCITAAVFAVKTESLEGDKLLLKKHHFDEAIKEIKNKNYSSYLEMQSKGKNAGFQGKGYQYTVDQYLIDDEDI